MKLRTHLVLLVLGAVLPVFVFSAIVGVVFWRQQHAAIDQRHLERVRALAIALDREMEGHIRALQVLATSQRLRAGDLAAFYRHAQEVRGEQPAWDAVVLTDETAGQLLNTRVPFGTPLPKTAAGEALIRRVIETQQPAISPLIIAAVARKPIAAIVVPVRRGGVAVGTLIAGIDPRVWLDLFLQYPLAPGATITVLDQQGIITARTLHPEQWVGKRPSATLAERAAAMSEGTYRNPGGLDGQPFYSAFARSRVGGWTVATGVPASVVEREVRASVIGMVAGAALMASLAVGLAFVFGRRVARPVIALASSVRRVGAGEPPAPLPTSSVDEVREVAHAFEETAARLRAREAALLEANRAKDAFLAVLSHELRTPINAVYGWARMLRDAPMDAATTRRALDVIERNAAAQVRLIEDLLDISRIVAGKMRLEVRDVDVAKVIDGALDAVRHAAQMKEIHIETTIAPHVGAVTGDPDRLQQVVWNLLSNAIKFTPSGGRVSVRLERRDARVDIVVSDTGPGIAPDLLPHVFESFRQADSTSTRVHGGLGLGLALVKHIVELHGGDVRAESAGEGMGATFTVTLPIAAP